MVYDIRILEQQDEEDYRNFLKDKDYIIEHTIEWKEIVRKNFGFRPFYLVARNRQEEIKSILPLFEADSLLFGRRIVSTPYAVSTGPLSEEDAATAEIVEHAKTLTVQRNAGYLEIRGKTPIKKFIVKKPVTNFYLKLSEDPSDVWARLPKSSVRWGIKKSQKSGLSVRQGNSQKELDDFFRLFLSTRKFRGVPAYPYSMFNDILASFKDLTRIYISELDGMPVAAIWLLCYNKKIRYWYAGVKYDKSVLRMQPYHALFWEAIKYGCENNYSIFNFGGATKFANDGGLYNFKERWADEMVEIPSNFYLNTARQVPSVNTTRFRFLESIWSKLPATLIQKLSPFVIKQFV